MSILVPHLPSVPYQVNPLFRHMKSHNKEKHVNIDDLSQPQLIMQHFRNYDLDKNGKIDGLELLKAALIMNGKDLLRSYALL